MDKKMKVRIVVAMLQFVVGMGLLLQIAPVLPSFMLTTIGVLFGNWHADFSYKKKALIPILLLLVGAFIPLLSVGATNSLVGVTGTTNGVRLSHQRKSWYASGRYWVAYSNQTGAGQDYPAMLIKSSTPGVLSWDLEPTVVARHRNILDGNGYQFAIHYDGTYLHIVKAWDTGDVNVSGPTLSYRRGVCNSNGTITWSALWQTLEMGDALRFNVNPSICVGSDGKVHVISGRRTNGDWGAYYWVNSLTNGSWVSEDAGWLKKFGFPNYGGGIVIPMQNEVKYIYAGNDASGKIYERNYNGSLQAESELVAAGARTVYYMAMSGVQLENDELFFAYLQQDNDIVYRTYNGTAWSSDTDVVTTSDNSPTVTKVDADTVYIFWYKDNTDAIYYRVWTSTGGLAAERTLTTATDLMLVDNINSYYEILGDTYHGITYLDNASLDVMFVDVGITSDFEITNREIGADIVKTDYKEYRCVVTFEDDIGINIPTDTVGVRFTTGSRLYYIYYNITSGDVMTTNSSHMYVTRPTYTSNATYGQLVYYWYPLSAMVDQAEVDFYTMGNTSTYDTGWVLAAENYVDFLSFSGITKWETYGTAGRIEDGDWMNIYAELNSSTTVQYITPNIQGAFMTLSLNPAYGMTNAQEKNGTWIQAGRYIFGMDYSIDGQGWVGGWECVMRPWAVNLTAEANYVTFQLSWTGEGGYGKTDYVTGYWWGHDSGDDRVNFVIRFWYNRENGSSVVGGWIQPLEYGITKTAPWWFPDITGDTWKPVKSFRTGDVPAPYVDTPAYSSFFFIPLEDDDDNIISYKDIDTTMFYAAVYGHATLPESDQFRIDTVMSQEILVGGHQDSHYSHGIPTPFPIEPTLVSKGLFVGLLKWAAPAFYSIARTVQSVFLDSIDWLILMATGEEAVMTNIFRVFGMFASSVVRMITTFIGFAWNLVFTYTANAWWLIDGVIFNLTGLVNNIIGPIQAAWSYLWSYILILNAIASGTSYTSAWGNTYDFTHLSGFEIFGYTGGYAWMSLLLFLYVCFIPVRMGMAMQYGAGAAINVLYAPLWVIWKVTWLFYKLITIPLRFIAFVLSLVSNKGG